MSLLEESIKLLWRVLEEGKANKEHITVQQNEFLKAATKAVRQTLSYIRDENKRDRKTEEKLSELWANVALAARPFDSDLAERCYIKSNYWANPDKWSKEEVEKAGIEIERIDTEVRNYFKGKVKAKKPKPQRTIERTEVRDEELQKKFSWKKIWAIVISSILVLAALTTLILNLDKIKELVRDQAASQTATSSEPSNYGRTPLYARTKKRVYDISERIEEEKINPWRFINIGKMRPVTRHDGKIIPCKGVMFTGAPRLIFWSDDFIPPFIEDAIVQVFDETIEECHKSNLEPKPYIDEANRLLNGFILHIYARMADIDQKLCSTTNSKKAGRRDTSLEVKKMQECLKEHYDAALLLASEGKITK